MAFTAVGIRQIVDEHPAHWLHNNRAGLCAGGQVRWLRRPVPANEASQDAKAVPKPLTLHTVLLELVPVAQGQAGPAEPKTSLAAPQARRYVVLHVGASN